MILDGSNFFSSLSLGDVITTVGATVGDHASTNVIDGGVYGASFSTVANGGAYVNPFLVAKVHTAFTTTSTTGTLQLVLQESATENFASPVDLMVSPVFNVNDGDLPANQLLIAIRMPQIKMRYIRLVYRVAGETLTAGSIIAFLTKDADLIDLYLRKADGYISFPTGAMNQSQANGVLDS